MIKKEKMLIVIDKNNNNFMSNKLNKKLNLNAVMDSVIE